METKITTFIFDCFGVICDPVLNGWYRENRLKKGLVDENLKNVFKKFDLGQSSEEDIVDYFLSYKEIISTKEKMREEIDSFLKLDDKLVEIIKKLRNKGFKIILLSNGHSAFYNRKIYPTYPEFKSLFDDIIISSDIGMVKPDSDIYLYALEKNNIKPKESLFIDDSKSNVDAAVNLGINGFTYTDSDLFLNYINQLGISI